VAHGLEEAQRAIERTQFEMIVVSVHFDGSRMLSSGRHANRSLVCARSQRFVSRAISIEGLEIADASGRSAVRKLLDELPTP
jgi:hypothetical protein